MLIDYFTREPYDIKPYFEGKSVCIAGSTSHAIKCEKGKEIDKHDIVIRLNLAPVKGYEKDVGDKTNIRMLNWHALNKVKNFNVLCKGLDYIICMDSGGHPFKSYKTVREKYPNIKLLILGDMQFDEIRRYFKKGTTVWASIGYFTIRLMYRLGFQTNVYFMGYVKDNNQKAKYYGKGVTMARYVRTHHKFNTEKLIFKQMMKKGTLHFVYPKL